jgi:hypothetical protein
MVHGHRRPRSPGVIGAKRSMPTLRKAKPEQGRESPASPQRRKSADRPLRRAASSAPGLLPERQARHRDRRAVLPPASQGELVTYKHPKDYPGEYVARKFIITEDFYGPSNISSRSLRDVRNILGSLYPRLDPVETRPRRRTAYRGGMVMTRDRPAAFFFAAIQGDRGG